MLLPKLGGFWLLPPRDFSQLNESHPMDHDSNSSGHTNNIENDPVHIPFAHRESEFFLRRPREVPTVAQEETEWGLLLTTQTQSGRVQFLHYGMPNILSFRESDRDHLAWRAPIDDEHHHS
jgi:hypothetical protein